MSRHRKWRTWRPGALRHCDGKMRYLTERAAMLARSVHYDSKRAAPSKKRPLSVYECPSCKFWHLGNPPRRPVERPA